MTVKASCRFVSRMEWGTNCDKLKHVVSFKCEKDPGRFQHQQIMGSNGFEQRIPQKAELSMECKLVFRGIVEKLSDRISDRIAGRCCPAVPAQEQIGPGFPRSFFRIADSATEVPSQEVFLPTERA